MTGGRVKPATLFLLEIIAAVLIFMLSSVVCIQILAKAHIISNDNYILGDAVNDCSSIAEIVKASSSKENAINDILKAELNANASGNIVCINKGDYSLNIELVESDSMIKAIIVANNAAKQIYELEYVHYIGGALNE